MYPRENIILGNIFKRCILEGSNGSKKQKKAKKKMESSLQRDFVVTWDEARAIIGCPTCATGQEESLIPKPLSGNTYIPHHLAAELTLKLRLYKRKVDKILYYLI